MQSVIESTRLKYGKEVYAVDTGFGEIFVRTDADSDDKVRIFDSDGEYLDYVESETFIDEAEERGVEFEDVIRDFANELTSKASIYELLNSISLGSYATKSIKEAVRISGCANQKELYRNEMVNKIGPYYVVSMEH